MQTFEQRRSRNERRSRKLIGPFDLDAMTRELTAFPSFDAMVADNGGGSRGYRPTLRPDLGVPFALLADAYDYAQRHRFCDKRAYRG